MSAFENRLLLVASLACVSHASLAYDSNPARTVTIVAFGPSNTEGKLVPRADAYPAQLEQKLKDLGLAVRVLNQGESGDNTFDLRRRMERAIPEGTQIVLFQPGGNECGPYRPRRVDETRENVDAMLTWMQTRKLAVLVLGTGCREEITTELTAKHGFTYYGKMGNGLDDFARPDGVHFLKEGYGRLAELLLPHVRALIDRLN